jgi:hypothetical protein
VDQAASTLWDDMLEEFRVLGGTADNVSLKAGRYGRGLFPVDPSKPVKLHIPDTLLLDPKYVSIVNGNFSVDTGAPIGRREKSFLENYERDFSWGATHHETEGLLQMFHAAPAELRELLSKSFDLDPWLTGPTAEAVFLRFFTSRLVHYKDRPVIMPIVELANHGSAPGYELEDGVGLSGRFEDEVLVRYNQLDPLQVFHHWGFVSNIESFAWSLSFGISLGSKQLDLRIRRNDLNFEEGRDPFYPQVQKDGEQTVLSKMLLGHKEYPAIPRGIFYRVCREAGVDDAAELFDRIQHVNRMQFLRLAQLSETAAPRLGRLLRNLVYAQLELLSNSFGARDPSGLPVAPAGEPHEAR